MTISERPNHELIQSGQIVVDLYLYFVFGAASNPDSPQEPEIRCPWARPGHRWFIGPKDT